SESSAVTLLITLDRAGESLSVVSNNSSYTFGSNANFNNGGVSVPGNFVGFGTGTLTVNNVATYQYRPVMIINTSIGTTVAFNDSSANAYSDAFIVQLNNGSGGVSFSGASAFAAGNLIVTCDATITDAVGTSLSVTGTANLSGTSIPLGDNPTDTTNFGGLI